jgi:hypothetical protein
MAGSASAGDEGQRERGMTVLRVRPRAGHDEVIFAESARIYRLLHDNPAYQETLRKLEAAAGRAQPVRVRFDQPNGGIIERVE